MNEKLTLSELQALIRDSLYLSLPDMYWVVGEISEIKENYSGHCYLELIEKQADERNVRARVRANIWSKRYRFLKPLFESSTGVPLREGMKILVKVKIEYHEIFGLSLVISDLDPSYTAGEMAIKRQMVIKKLEEEGVFSMNKELDFPVFPGKIAVVSSKNAAGYTDFINHLKANSQGYVFYTALFEAVMQGTETEKSVINALDRISEHPGLFDVVAIIRGGGSQSDLSWFDSYNIAFHVTQFPIPVITGIGHEKDISVTDMVASRAFKTPTAAASHLIECMSEAEDNLNFLSTGISTGVMALVNENRNRIESNRLRLIPSSRLLLSRNKEKLSSGIFELINFGKEYIVRAGFIPVSHKSRLMTVTGSLLTLKNTYTVNYINNLVKATKGKLGKSAIETNNLEKGLKAVDPANVLKRGYTITSFKGKIIKDPGMISKDDIIDTVFSTGRLKSRVLGK